MNRLLCGCVVTLASLTLQPRPSFAQPTGGPQVKKYLPAVREQIDAEAPDLDKLYRGLHANPELSLMEEKTAARMAKELQQAGFTVTTRVGGHGVVGVFKNGPGPTVLVRADMDALPVTESTGLPYASKVRTRDKDGNEVGVMHACGHDMHMTCFVGTARVLTKLKDSWQGTLVFMAQPGEEVGAGCRMMLADGLLKRFPRPDYCFALHCDSRTPHGQVSYAEGMLMANVDTLDITVKGKGGHGSAPHTTIDPIVLSAKIILDLQTIVSREVNPSDPTVVTVGSIHGGTKHNIIPSDVKLQLTIRTLRDDNRKHVLEAIERIVKSAAKGARAPDPILHFDTANFTPAVHNDGPLARKTAAAFASVLGEDKVQKIPPFMGGEDFGRLGLEGIPIFLYFIGTTAPERVAESLKPGGTPIPSLHSDFYYPVSEPSLRTGVLTMSSAVLNILGK